MFDPALQLWTKVNLDELYLRFVQSPDEGEGDFQNKLRSQLADAAPEAIQLMAEILWVILLFPSGIGASKKRKSVAEIWSWSGLQLDLSSPYLADDVLGGIGSAGTAYNTQRWREVAFLIESLRALRGLEKTEQRAISINSERFVTWFEDQPGAGNRQLLNILPHLLFPDEFERISSRGDKVSVLEHFSDGVSKRQLRKRKNAALDRELLDRRRGLETEKGAPIDFYDDDLKRQWKPANVKVPDNSGGSSFAARLSNFLDAFAAARAGPFTTVGPVGQAMSGLKAWLESCSPVAKSPTLKVKVSVGQGGWTKTPWIALLDDRVTTSTQRGIYIVFLIAEDLSMTYLTLNQGMTDLVRTMGQRQAVDEMQRVSLASRPQIAETIGNEFCLDSAIDLKSDTTAARNYEAGTIAHLAIPRHDLPTDGELGGALSALIAAYDLIIDGAPNAPEIEDMPNIEDVQSFTIDDALEDLFLEREEIEELLLLWRAKKNLILQGPPGVGKSFAAQRLAYALIGAADPTRVNMVQFHQSYSYEDFVQGYRPSGEGFALRQGKFVDFCLKALVEPAKQFVFVIDEINRGNLSRILGELMLLVEPDKRDAKWATALAYSDAKFFVPPNVSVLGLMNTADRSLAVVDYALRRRFAFVGLSSRIDGDKFSAELDRRGVSSEVVARIRDRVGSLNAEIIGDNANLGPGFEIGHSFFCGGPMEEESSDAWYRRIIKTEILPLLREYWFDAPSNAETWAQRLLG
ncbi:MrcB family domain-containing protein [Sphingomonas japonica]|uniref:AAA+ ATPase domain-containing protein n=1 Tax=Sphingomonas japonica TaxID=511662 RepID=A0ABX0U294_9SPHN|nr:DUF3578 domain-containing protein [Sphingomonas japonica]NIJ24624.1 hypothetical protein [Sphingomonas japonica]